VTSSPNYPRSNGFIERQVRWIKPVVKKCIKRRQNIQIALLNLRATPTDNKIPSPAELLMNRKLSTFLPHREEEKKTSIREDMQNKKIDAKTYHDKTARKLKPFHDQQTVNIMDKQKKTWCPGKVIRKHKTPRSYIVETSTGAQVRRNRSHLSERLENSVPQQEHQQEQNTQVHSSQTTIIRKSGRVTKAPDRYGFED
jgi:hypothetical protein